MRTTPPAPLLLDTGRLQSLSDGIFSIVMTLLVFEINLPAPEHFTTLSAALLALWPKFLAYAISFALLGIYWMGQRTGFQYIPRADPAYHWLTILFFACVSLVPFSAKVLGRFPYDRLALILYGLNLTVIGLMFYVKWSYAAAGRRLISDDTPDWIIRFAKLRSLLAPACYLIAIACVFIHPAITLALYALVPALYIVPGLQTYWMRLAGWPGFGSSTKDRAP